MDEVSTIQTGMANGVKLNITQIINDYSKRLLGFIRRRVPTEEDAEDVLQDVFYQLVGNTQPIDQMTGWLFTVARNKIIDRQRKKQTESLDELTDDDEPSIDLSALITTDRDTAETQYLRNLFWEELNNALDELPAEQKDVYVMNELEGVPFKQISEMTGVPVNTLISRKRYAVLFLRERLIALRDELMNY